MVKNASFPIEERYGIMMMFSIVECVLMSVTICETVTNIVLECSTPTRDAPFMHIIIIILGATAYNYSTYRKVLTSE